MNSSPVFLTFCSFLFVTWPFYVKAESIWVKYGNQVFRGVGDAKAVALSESGVAAATGPLAILWNPACLSSNTDRSLVYAHQERFAGAVTFDIIGLDLKQRSKSNWSLVIIREAVQGIPKTTDALLYETGSLDDPAERVLSSNVTFFNQSQWAGVIGFASSRGECNRPNQPAYQWIRTHGLNRITQAPEYQGRAVYSKLVPARIPYAL